MRIIAAVFVAAALTYAMMALVKQRVETKKDGCPAGFVLIMTTYTKVCVQGIYPE